MLSDRGAACSLPQLGLLVHLLVIMGTTTNVNEGLFRQYLQFPMLKAGRLDKELMTGLPDWASLK